MSQAIHTKILKGGRIKATAARGIACRAARIFLETTKDGWEGRTV